MDTKKIVKLIGHTKFEELTSLPVEDLKREIVKAEKNVATAENDLKENESIKTLKEDLKECTAPYKDAIKCQRAIQRFCSFRIGEREV